MATLTRQPFAPLDGARLQTLTSLKNRQNAISSSPTKRKAFEVTDIDDSENVDPILFSKRTKGVDSVNGTPKPPAFVLIKASSTPTLTSSREKLSRIKTSRKRTLLQPKSPAARLNTKVPVSTSLTAPAGRSPICGSKRIGILSHRRTTRTDPPSNGLGSATPLSLDAALKGTIPSYGRSKTPASSSHSTASAVSSTVGELVQAEMKSTWFFDIHEDTPEQEMTNLLQHGTCTLDISSHEESSKRASRERAEGRDKENIPPADDISQTRAVRSSRRLETTGVAAMVAEHNRGPLAEMNAANYYAEGCDETSLIILPDDEGIERAPSSDFATSSSHELTLKLNDTEEDRATEISIDALMSKKTPANDAALLAPIEGTGESFELWESSSAKDEASAPSSPILAPVEDAADVPTTVEC